MRKGLWAIISLTVIALALAPCSWAASDVIKIGFNIPLTGDNPDVGASSKNAAEMFLKHLFHHGGGQNLYPQVHL